MKIEDYRLVPPNNEEQLKLTVSCQPVVAHISICDLTVMQFYSAGIYKSRKAECESPIISHAVVVFGYGSDELIDENEKPYKMNYWLVRNTYGEKWGENGYIKLARGEDTDFDYGQNDILRAPMYPVIEGVGCDAPGMVLPKL